MAVAPDSARYLVEMMLRKAERLQDVLACMGIIYLGKITVQSLWRIVLGLQSHLWPQFMARITERDLTTRYGTWAVVTGMIDGIGEAYAREMARRDLNIILISDCKERIQDLAFLIGSEYGVETLAIDAKFTDGRDSIEVDIKKDMENKDVGIIVNNVWDITAISPGNKGDSFAVRNELKKTELWNRFSHNMIFMKAAAPQLMKSMLVSKKGAIINIVQGSNHYCLPVVAISMVYRDYFSQARRLGITVQTVVPADITFDESKSKAGIFAPKSSVFAAHALATLGYTSHTTGYWAHGLQVWLMQWIPWALLQLIG